MDQSSAMQINCILAFDTGSTKTGKFLQSTKEKEILKSTFIEWTIPQTSDKNSTSKSLRNIIQIQWAESCGNVEHNNSTVIALHGDFILTVTTAGDCPFESSGDFCLYNKYCERGTASVKCCQIEASPVLCGFQPMFLLC